MGGQIFGWLISVIEGAEFQMAGVYYDEIEDYDEATEGENGNIFGKSRTT